MTKSRRIGALVAATAATVGMATLVAPTAAEAAARGPQPVSNFVQRVRANTETWVSIRWQTDRRICDARVWVNGRNVDVDYPRNARTTSFSRGDSLSPGRTDFTAFRVDANYRRTGVALLRATIQYDNCGRFDRTVRRSFGLAMPVVAFRPGGPIGGGHGGPGNGHGGPGHGNGNGNGGPGHGHGNGPGNGNGGPGHGHGNGPGNGNGPGSGNGNGPGSGNGNGPGAGNGNGPGSGNGNGPGAGNGNGNGTGPGSGNGNGPGAGNGNGPGAGNGNGPGSGNGNGPGAGNGNGPGGGGGPGQGPRPGNGPRI